MRNTSIFLLLSSTALGLGACGNSLRSNGAPAGGAAPTTNTQAGAGGTSTAPPDGTLLPDGPCTPGIPVTTQIPRLLNRQYENVVRDLLGVTALDGNPVSAALVGDFSGAMTAPAWQVYQEVGAKIAAQVMAGPSKAKFISCDPAAAGCLTATIQAFGRKAFRRALTVDEIASFETLSKTTPAGTPAQVAEATLNAFLVSPSFLLLPELDTATEGSAIKLSPQEVATRLSFLLWGSVPDDLLNAAADGNQLQTKEQILAEAQRMIAIREKTGPLVSAFHDEWAQMNNGSGHWWKIDHDPAKFPTYAAAAKASYQQELDRFFE